MSAAIVARGYLADLSKGAILPVEFEDRGDGVAWEIDDHGRSNWTRGSWKIGKNLFLTEAEARKSGEDARTQKIARLRKQFDKYEAMTFVVKA